MKTTTLRKMAVVAAIITSGLSAQAQTLVLSDNFDTGGVATNDLNYNLLARQAGTAATNSISATTNTISHTLTDTGKLHMKGTVGQFDGIGTDSFGPEIGSDSFRVKWKVQLDAAAFNWSMMSVVSDGNNDWNNSPMSVNVWHHDFIHLMYGSFTNIAPANDLLIDMPPWMVNAAIGGTYDANDLHEFEIRANASSATNGTYSCTMDGILLAAGLPYTFEDAAKKMSWWAGEGTDAIWDDLDVSTIPTVPAKEYVFFDNFNTANATDANWLYGDRQTNGIVVAPYTIAPNSFNIENNKLLAFSAGAEMREDIDLADHIVGEDFEFSVKMTMRDTGANWSTVYLYDDRAGDLRGNSRLGFLAWAGGHTEAFVLYAGTADGAGQTAVGVSVADMVAKLGSYDKSVEHTLQFISTAGVGGTNSYDFLVDGITIKSNLAYRFPGNTRKIGFLSILPTDITKGVLYDDMYVKVMQGTTYADWAEENGLVGGDALRTADVEPDGMDNLLEYVLGGNPNVDDAASILPTSDFTTDAIEYVYNRRLDAALRGLTYGLILNTNGLQVAWDSVGTAFETTTGAIDADFESVTNAIPITGVDVGFVNLEVTED